jgi:hypothetical protein
MPWGIKGRERQVQNLQRLCEVDLFELGLHCAAVHPENEAPVLLGK